MTDVRKEDFKNFVLDSGVVDSLNRVLASLYDEPVRPADPMEYIRQYLGAPKGVDAAALEKQNQDLKDEIAQIEAQIAEYKKQ